MSKAPNGAAAATAAASLILGKGNDKRFRDSGREPLLNIGGAIAVERSEVLGLVHRDGGRRRHQLCAYTDYSSDGQCSRPPFGPQLPSAIVSRSAHRSWPVPVADGGGGVAGGGGACGQRWTD